MFDIRKVFESSHLFAVSEIIQHSFSLLHVAQDKITQYFSIPSVPARHRSRSGEAGGSKAN